MLLNLENKTFLADFYAQQKSWILLSGELLGGFSHVGCLLSFLQAFSYIGFQHHPLLGVPLQAFTHFALSGKLNAE